MVRVCVGAPRAIEAIRTNIVNIPDEIRIENHENERRLWLAGRSGRLSKAGFYYIGSSFILLSLELIF